MCVLKDSCCLGEKLWQTRQDIKKQRHYFANKGSYSQSYGFSSSHVWMWELGHKESWALKNAFELRCWRRLLRVPWTARRSSQSIHPKGNQSWIIIGRTDAESEAPILWPHDANKWLIGKDPDAGKDWRQEGKGTTEDEMVGWHHQLNGHEFEQASGIGDGQGSLECCSSWGHKESNTTERLNWIESKTPFPGSRETIASDVLSMWFVSQLQTPELNHSLNSMFRMCL